MTAYRSVAEVEAELIALRAAAERAGRALACLFSSSDEFEAAVIKIRREQGAFGPQRRRRNIAVTGFLTILLAAAFLML
jgi:hypothetical protein